MTGPSIVAIGNFDGVHLGHQAVFEALLSTARRLGLVPWVLTFEPQPLEYLRPHEAPARLTNTTEKCALFGNYGIEHVRILPFDAMLAEMSAADFISKMLQETLHAQAVLVGHDFRFGHQRQGDAQLLATAGLDVHTTEVVCVEDVRVSSSRVREALALGDFARVRTYLGRAYTMQGVVVHGDKRGRALGFPTANIRIDRLVSPLHGVYVVRVHGAAEHAVEAVASIGTRPTVGGREWLLEVYLLQGEWDLYGVTLTVEFCHKCRDEIMYSSLELLVEQMKQDVILTRSYFSHERV